MPNIDKVIEPKHNSKLNSGLWLMLLALAMLISINTIIAAIISPSISTEIKRYSLLLSYLELVLFYLSSLLLPLGVLRISKSTNNNSKKVRALQLFSTAVCYAILGNLIYSIAWWILMFSATGQRSQFGNAFIPFAVCLIYTTVAWIFSSKEQREKTNNQQKYSSPAVFVMMIGPVIWLIIYSWTNNLIIHANKVINYLIVYLFEVSLLALAIISGMLMLTCYQKTIKTSSLLNRCSKVLSIITILQWFFWEAANCLYLTRTGPRILVYYAALINILILALIIITIIWILLQLKTRGRIINYQ